MILWGWVESEAIWEARELPTGAVWRFGGDTVVLALGAGRALLLARDGVWVNGLPSLPAKVLVHLDEVRAAGSAVIVSAESRHEPAPLQAQRDGAACARCKGTMTAGELAVICAACDSPHHPDCFTFDTRCAACPFPTHGVLTAPGSVS